MSANVQTAFDQAQSFRTTATDAEILALRDRVSVSANPNVKIVASIAKGISDAEWIAVIRHGQAPDVVPISPSQLERLAGGFKSYTIWDGSDFWGQVGVAIFVWA